MTLEECNIGNCTTRDTHTNSIVIQHSVLMQRPENSSLFSIVITKVRLWTPCWTKVFWQKFSFVYHLSGVFVLLLDDKGKVTLESFRNVCFDGLIWYDMIYDIWYDIFNCNWVATRWQELSTHIHTNNTENNTKQTIHTTTTNNTYKYCASQKFI